MITHKNKAIFVHIPKTGGTSISDALGHFEFGLGQDHRSIRMVQPIPDYIMPSANNGIELMRRAKYRLMAKHNNPNNYNSINRKQYRNYFKFAFVRNPWSRAYSWYRALKRDTKLGARLGVTENTSLYDALVANVGKDLLRPQTYWLKNYLGKIDLDFVGRFEDLGRDSQVVFDRLGIVRALPPPKRVIKHKVDYRTQFDKKSTNLIADFYREEIKIFGYRFA